MMRHMNRLRIAARYLKGHLRRFFFLIIAMSFCFAVVTSMTAVSAGMREQVYTAAEQHYAGHLFVLGFQKRAMHLGRMPEGDQVREVVNQILPDYTRIVARTNYFTQGILYFNGSAVRQKYVYGVDWEAEEELFRRQAYSAGGSADLTGTNGVYLSRHTAEELNIAVGDAVLLEVDTWTGQKNLVELTVAAIIDDDSIFGSFRCYLDRTLLNTSLGLEADAASFYGIYLDSPRRAPEAAQELRAALSMRLPTAALIEEKSAFTRELNRSWEGTRYFVIPLEVYVSQVTSLLQAMDLVSYFLYLVMALITLASVFVTYRLILQERERELATMQAIGIPRADISAVLVLESLGVLGLSLGAGFLLSLLMIAISGLFSYDWIPGFEIFLRNGRLSARFTLVQLVGNSLLLAAIVIPAVLIPSRAQLARKPVESLA